MDVNLSATANGNYSYSITQHVILILGGHHRNHFCCPAIYHYFEVRSKS